MPPLFTAPRVWYGGAFELAVELGEHSDERLRLALAALWSHSTLRGCYLSNKAEPGDQLLIHPTDLSLLFEDPLYGFAGLPNGKQVACRSIVVREDDGPDWVYFGVPMGALSAAYEVGAYPFDDGTSLDWIAPMGEWLRGLAVWMYGAVNFQLGLVGFIVGGTIYAKEVVRTGVPEQRWEGYLWPVAAELKWYPQNMGFPFTVYRNPPSTHSDA